jgi:hypothetical protein
MLSVYDGAPSIPQISESITNSRQLLCFLTISRNGLVSLVHTLGKYSAGLGETSASHGRIFGLIGEKVGGQLPPGVMAPTGGLVPMLTLKSYGVPARATLAAQFEVDPSIALATTTGQVVGEREWVELSQLIYPPKR